jgi:hypothetical protein
LESTAQLAAVGVGELTSVDGLSATAQEALGGMSGGCLAYFVEGHEGDDEQGLGLGAKINVVVFILFLRKKSFAEAASGQTRRKLRTEIVFETQDLSASLAGGRGARS